MSESTQLQKITNLLLTELYNSNMKINNPTLYVELNRDINDLPQQLPKTGLAKYWIKRKFIQNALAIIDKFPPRGTFTTSFLKDNLIEAKKNIIILSSKPTPKFKLDQVIKFHKTNPVPELLEVYTRDPNINHDEIALSVIKTKITHTKPPNDVQAYLSPLPLPTGFTLPIDKARGTILNYSDGDTTYIFNAKLVHDKHYIKNRGLEISAWEGLSDKVLHATNYIEQTPGTKWSGKKQEGNDTWITYDGKRAHKLGRGKPHTDETIHHYEKIMNTELQGCPQLPEIGFGQLSKSDLNDIHRKLAKNLSKNIVEAITTTIINYFNKVNFALLQKAKKEATLSVAHLLNPIEQHVKQLGGIKKVLADKELRLQLARTIISEKNNIYDIIDSKIRFIKQTNLNSE
jgi:hypothetical protein